MVPAQRRREAHAGREDEPPARIVSAGDSMPAQPQTQQPWAAIAAVTVLTLPLGSIYAFSVFLKPIETELGIPRSALSFVFGLATVGFTFGMNLAPLLYRLALPAVLIMANAVRRRRHRDGRRRHGLPMLLLGYSVVFGIAGGIIFIILQQAVNLSGAHPVRSVERLRARPLAVGRDDRGALVRLEQ